MKRLAAILLALCVPGMAALTPVDEAAFQKLVESHKGKVVVYDFWATWCDGCRAELPKLLALETKLRAQGFELVTISADEPEQDDAAEKFLKRFALRGPRYRKQPKSDDQFINSIDVKWSGALPALFLYDKTGRKIRSFIGETDMATVEAAIRKLL
ncbi:MAG TPA: TlpA disulfide reductase family protein [Bryobacteraceae bacterium]|nr:TlpA disulfide reductase family protein [Bryobacteraceae bacterium]